VPGFFVISETQTRLQVSGITKKANCAAAGFGLVKPFFSGSTTVGS
jgi:hypothetical protein